MTFFEKRQKIVSLTNLLCISHARFYHLKGKYFESYLFSSFLFFSLALCDAHVPVRQNCCPRAVVYLSAHVRLG